MSHIQQLTFVEIVRGALRPDPTGYRVLEVGSYDVNGSVRRIFSDAALYIGIDLCEGPGVDRVASGSTLDLPDESLDIVLSCECFEHDPAWDSTFANMFRMLRPGGALIFTCASTGRHEHGTSRTDSTSPGTQSVGIDYYRNLTRRDFERRFDLPGWFENHAFFYNFNSRDLYFYGVKRAAPGALAPAADIACLDTAALRDNAAIRNLITVSKWTPGRVFLHGLGLLLSDKAYQNLWFSPRFVWFIDASRRLLRGGLAGKQDG